LVSKLSDLLGSLVAMSVSFTKSRHEE
jgi:hypothetical protein